MTKLLSKKIIKQSIRNNWKLWLILTAVLCLFLTMMTLVSSRSNGMGPGGQGRTFELIDMYAQAFFGNMGIIVLIIYIITIGNKLVASEVDKGILSYTLNTPITRKQVIFSKGLFYIVSITLMTLLLGLIGMSVSLMVGAELPLDKFWMLILGYWLYGFAISGICYFASCWFNKSGNSIMIGAGAAVLFFLLNALSGLEDLEFMKYFTINTLFDTDAIIAGSGYAIQFIALLGIGVILYSIGINKFLKKDLPL